jgi:outer membrane murein-binding lipoprotein Lpp
MNRFVVIAGIFGVLFLTGCRKEQDCEMYNTGTIRLVNSSNAQVRVYLDNTLLSEVSQNRQVEVNGIAAGQHHIYAEQLINQPNSWESDITVLRCDRLNVGFTE